MVAAASATDRSVLPLPAGHYDGKVGRYLADSDPPRFPPMVTAPDGAPNVLLILLDDVGFGQTGTFGGGIETPALDSLARQGLRYSQFHTTALCSPTRAALLTGRNHHAVGSGRIIEMASGYDGYNSIIPTSAATVAETLRMNGYATAMVGKHHNTPDWETSRAGPFGRWPTGLGFDYFYGFMGGETHQYQPTLFEYTLPVPDRPHDATYHLTTDLADHAVDWMRQVKAAAPQRPLFLYVAPAATHAPHHAPREWIERFAGRFDAGWDEYRRLTLERQKHVGMVPLATDLTPRPDGIAAWDSLTPEQKKVYARMMEVFAGFTAHADHEMGRVIQAARDLPGGVNTLVIYIAGDNGASAEGGPQGTLNSNSLLNGRIENAGDMVQHLDQLGTGQYFNHFPYGWAHAMNTPFQWYKMVTSHLGGVRNGMVIAWPARLAARGEVRPQFHHVVDVAPTILEAAGVPAPRYVNGVEQQPVDGTSMLYTFDQPEAPSRRRTQYFELAANRAIYHDGWIAAAKYFAVSDYFTGKPVPRDAGAVNWELYDLTRDYSEAHDLAAREPARLRAMEELFWQEAKRNQVLPLGLNSEEDMEGIYRPSYIRGMSEFVYAPGVQLPEGSAPRLKNASFRIDADAVLAAGRTEGVLLAAGGRFGGLALYIKGDRPIGEEPIERTVPRRFSLSETFDVGFDSGTPVAPDYASPARFNGSLRQVRIRLMETPNGG